MLDERQVAYPKELLSSGAELAVKWKYHSFQYYTLLWLKTHCGNAYIENDHNRDGELWIEYLRDLSDSI